MREFRFSLLVWVRWFPRELIGSRMPEFRVYRLLLPLLASFALAVALVGVARAQSATTAAPAAAFDVASVRPNTTADQHTHSSIYNSWTNSKFTATNVPLKMLLEFCYDVPQSRLMGGPGWIDSTTFDIEAKSDSVVDEQMASLPPEQAKEQKREMVRSLLADRFKLAVHTETRTMPVYALVVAKGGAKLKADTKGNYVGTGRNTITVRGGDNSVAILADKLSEEAGRMVVDKTGITGQYDMVLRWTPEDQPPPMLNGQPDPNAPPGLFTAIQEQLGLKLESSQGAVPVQVIDHVEMPSEN
jgi:uncharacterized protein (TIGR03435 family)